jgi:hypothetical protein
LHNSKLAEVAASSVKNAASSAEVAANSAKNAASSAQIAAISARILTSLSILQPSTKIQICYIPP